MTTKNPLTCLQPPPHREPPMRDSPNTDLLRLQRCFMNALREPIFDESRERSELSPAATERIRRAMARGAERTSPEENPD